MQPTFHAPSANAPKAQNSARRRILVMDDEPDILELLRLTLQAEGFDIVTAANGRAAIEACRNSFFDLAILDVSMKGIDGVDVASRLRTGKATSTMKIVFHTGVAESEIRHRLPRYDAYLQKPAEPLKLVYAVRKAIATPGV